MKLTDDQSNNGEPSNAKNEKAQLEQRSVNVGQDHTGPIITGDHNTIYNSPPPAQKTPLFTINTYPPKLSGFAGRASTVAEIYEIIKTNNKTTDVLTISISGAGGIGKSTLAAHLIYELEKDDFLKINHQVLWSSLNAGDAKAILEAWKRRLV